MKKNNTVKVVLVVMLLFMLLTWIIPAAYFSGEYAEQGRIQMGLFDLFNYPLTSLSYFGYIAFFIVLVGGFYGILYKIPAYRTFLDKMVAKFAGKGKLVIAIFMVLLAVITSICGLQFGLAIFIPLIVSIILLMGYDKIVAALTVVGSIGVGLAGSTYAYTNLSILLSALQLKIGYEIEIRFVILLVGLIVLMFNTFMYIKKHKINGKNNIKLEKKTIKKVEVVEAKEEDKEKKVKTSKTTTKATSKTTSKKQSTNKKAAKNYNKAATKDENIIVVKENGTNDNDELVPTIVGGKHKIWPFVISFLLLFVLIILAFVTWGENGFGITLFEDVTKNVLEYELFDFPLFGKLLGTVNPFGEWVITDMFLPLAIVTLLLVIIYKVKLEDVFDGFIKGAKKALAPAVLVILIYTCLVIVTYHPFQLVIYKAILGLSKGFNIATTALVGILASLFNADPSYVYQSVLPYYTSVVTNSDNYSIVAIMFQSLYGFTMLVGPTSVVLMSVLAYLNINYKDWLKNAWKFLLEFLIILFIIFIILALI